MTLKHTHRVYAGRWNRRGTQAGAFSLVELLTVVFIISLLIGILIPSVNGARNAAKKATTAKALKSIEVGLEMFKDDNGDGFRLTNGYPPSFAHPPIPGYPFKPHLGEFPFLPDAPDANPAVTGAHWLPAMLMGVDNLGYVRRSSVPRDLRAQPYRWYTPVPSDTHETPLERQPLYIDPGSLKTKATKDLPGRANEDLFPDWDEMNELPVIVDAFDQPVLYYVANTHGRTTNMVDLSRENPQGEGVPFFFHEDNLGFTGVAPDTETSGSETSGTPGWDLGNRQRHHAIARPGATLTAEDLIEPENRETFARYIIDRKVYRSIVQNENRSAATPLRPVNADKFLLISAGPDGRYGTNDDVTNMPPWTE